jgi:hypothetical protein
MQSKSMPRLADQLQPTTHALTHQEPKPLLLRLKNEADQKKLSQLLTKEKDLTVIDTYLSQLKEFFVINNPPLHQNHPKRDEEFSIYSKKHFEGLKPWQAGVWAYIPWRKTILHILEDEDFQVVRTARNRNLIPPAEQKKYYNSTIGIAGLSVGNSCALALVLMGGGKHLRLADPDTLELSNLNRIRGSIAELTAPKVYMTARQIYELDPYAKLELHTEGLTEENIQTFFDGPPKLDVMIDEMDNLAMKIRLREEAKKRGIPVVMATDNGDSGVIDIERHDLDKNVGPFHNRAGADIKERVVGKKLPLPVIGKIIGEELLGLDLIEPRMKASLLEIGRTVPTWPQLGGAAVLNGVAVAVAVRKILTGQPLIDNRSVLSLSSWLIPDYDSPEQIEHRRQETEQFKKTYQEAVEKGRKV